MVKRTLLFIYNLSLIYVPLHEFRLCVAFPRLNLCLDVHAVIQDDAITRPEVKHASEGRVLVNILGIFIN
jgi:hypothetical protein